MAQNLFPKFRGKISKRSASKQDFQFHCCCLLRRPYNSPNQISQFINTLRSLLKYDEQNNCRAFAEQCQPITAQFSKFKRADWIKNNDFGSLLRIGRCDWPIYSDGIGTPQIESFLRGNTQNTKYISSSSTWVFLEYFLIISNHQI